MKMQPHTIPMSKQPGSIPHEIVGWWKPLPNNNGLNKNETNAWVLRCDPLGGKTSKPVAPNHPSMVNLPHNEQNGIYW